MTLNAQPSRNINTEMDKLNTWFAINKLSLILAKAIFMLFSNCKEKNSSPPLIRPPSSTVSRIMRPHFHCIGVF